MGIAAAEGVSSAVIVGSVSSLLALALALVLVFLWAVYRRGGIRHLDMAAKAIARLFRRR